MSVVLEWNKGGGVIRVQVVKFKGRDRIDVREFVTLADGKSLVPTRKGVSLDSRDAVKLRRALRAAIRLFKSKSK